MVLERPARRTSFVSGMGERDRGAGDDCERARTASLGVVSVVPTLNLPGV